MRIGKNPIDSKTGFTGTPPSQNGEGPGESRFQPVVCDKCQTSLALSGDRLACPKCKEEKGRMCAGIPSFEAGEIYFEDPPPSQMKRLLEIALRDGWEKALASEFAQKEPRLYEFAMDTSRANFLHLVEITQEAAVLEVGCGLGLVTEELSRRCAKVVALDSTAERAAFTALRCRQQGRSNLWPVVGGFLRTPLRRNSFDLIVMNGRLKWFGFENRAEPPSKIQAQALRKAWELLRPGGCLYLGTENRIGYHAFRGRADSLGLPYTSLLPRGVADWYLGRRQGHRLPGNFGYRTYTYTLPGYRRLLRGAGFERIEAYAALPGYNQPRTFVSLEAPEPAAYYVSRFPGRSGAWRMVIALGRIFSPVSVLKAFGDDFALIARRPKEGV